jgi:CRISPR/Cas system-associated exonuclease Cas4 (RecB family)
MVLEGKIMETEADPIIEKLNALISGSQVSEWFKPGTRVLKETGILLPSGVTRRPDRVIVKDDTAVIIDFKFGEENMHHAVQVRQYGELLKEMGFRNTEGFLWYVDLNKIVNV